MLVKLSSIISNTRNTKTVESVKATFTTMIANLVEIEVANQDIAAEAQVTLDNANAEVTAAAAFRFGLGKLIAGE